MKKYRLILFAVLAVTLASCSTTTKIYQVYDVESTDLKQSDGCLAFSNEDCEITYASMWAEGGDVSFVFENKTDKDIYLYMSKSFFIRNGVAYDYYDDKEYSKTSTISLGASEAYAASAYGKFITNGGRYYPGTVSKVVTGEAGIASSYGVSTKEPELICVPAHSMKIIPGFSISKYFYLDCDDKDFNTPKKKSNTINYSKDNSPVVFRNRIAYAYGTSDEIKYIDNEFYVSSVTNYKDKEGVTYELSKEKDCISKKETETSNSLISGSKRFYNTKSETESHPFGVVAFIIAILGAIVVVKNLF
ncbi:MAG: hypothetical protein J5814_04170 [Bacteroidaceae bacterium]|nr:hypothetical protein [Bacteroidaceae bacterium]